MKFSIIFKKINMKLMDTMLKIKHRSNIRLHRACLCEGNRDDVASLRSELQSTQHQNSEK